MFFVVLKLFLGLKERLVNTIHECLSLNFSEIISINMKEVRKLKTKSLQKSPSKQSCFYAVRTRNNLCFDQIWFEKTLSMDL